MVPEDSPGCEVVELVSPDQAGQGLAHHRRVEREHQFAFDFRGAERHEELKGFVAVLQCCRTRRSEPQPTLAPGGFETSAVMW